MNDLYRTVDVEEPPIFTASICFSDREHTSQRLTALDKGPVRRPAV